MVVAETPGPCARTCQIFYYSGVRLQVVEL